LHEGGKNKVLERFSGGRKRRKRGTTYKRTCGARSSSQKTSGQRGQYAACRETRGPKRYRGVRGVTEREKGFSRMLGGEEKGVNESGVLSAFPNLI